MEDFTLLWQQVCLDLKEDLSDFSFHTWVEPLHAVALENNRLILVAPASNIRENLMHRCYEMIVHKVREKTNHSDFQVDILLESEWGQPQTPSFHSIEQKRHALNPAYTFDTFVVGTGNQFAHAAAVGASIAPGQKYNPLFIHGGTSLGKTHLMHAIGNAILETNPSANVMYVTSEQFSNALISVLMRKDPIDDFRKQYRGVDVLLLDDVQFLAGKGRCLEEFFHTFNDLYNAGKQIVLSSDKPPHEIVEFEERVRSRFAWGLTVDIALPDYETRIAFLRKRAELEHLLQIEKGALEYIASEDGLNFRQLDGRFNRVTAYASLMGQPITLALAEAALKDYTASQRKRALTPRNIIQIVCNQFDITYDDIVGKRRSRDIAVPRQFAMYLVRTLTDHSFPKIGELFGGRHYSTVMHDVEKVAQEIKSNAETKEMVEYLIAQIHES